MPLSEFLKMARGKLGSGQQKISPTTDLSSFPENEVVELVWENGQVMMQGQSSRAKKSPTYSNIQSSPPRVRDKYPENSSTSKIGKFSVMDSMLNNISLSVHTGEMDLTKEDEVVPWLSYSGDDSRQQDYCSQLFPEISGITANKPSGLSGFASMDKRGSSNQMIGDSHSVPIHNVANLDQRSASKVSSSRFSLLRSWSPQKDHASVPSLGAGVSDIVSGNTANNVSGNTANNPVSVLGDMNPSQASTAGIKSSTTQKQTLTGSGSGLLNFSHFSRPATFLKANLQNLTGGEAIPGSSTVEVKENKEKENVANSSIPVNSVPAEPYFNSRKENDYHFSPSMVSSTRLDRPCSVEQSDNICRDEPCNKERSSGLFTGSNATKEIHDGEKNVEHGVACSSVCSGSSAERESSDQPHNRKRKSRDNEESGGRSEDVEEESFDVKKARPARGGTGSKKSRAAEVHNLSERRRRDRINEKMRALQELIPNCNKADKASMLDEAIEYLKTLQLQVQIMSMGAGLCVPPMMFPTGMQHMHAARMPHYPPMGFGMGMGIGMGFGMGMLEMNGGSPGCPIFPTPPTMQGAHFPSPPIPGSATFPGMAGCNFHAFGHAAQGVPMSVPRAPFVPFAGQTSTNSAVGLSVARPGVHVDIPTPTPIPSLDPKNPVHIKDSLGIHNAYPSCSKNQTSSEVQATNEGLDRSSKNDQLPDVSDSAANTLTNQTDVPGSEAGEFV